MAASSRLFFQKVQSMAVITSGVASRPLTVDQYRSGSLVSWVGSVQRPDT
jgi:hypothetical protein